MRVEIPHFMVNEQIRIERGPGPRIDDEFDALSKLLSCFSIIGVICVISLLWVQAFVGLKQGHIIAYDVKKQKAVFIRNQKALFGPKISPKGMGGILYTPFPDIYGCNPKNMSHISRSQQIYSNVSKTNISKNEEYSTHQSDQSQSDRVDETVILLIRRGNCPFIDKARHAQEVGASAMVVFDNVEQVIDSTNQARLIAMGTRQKKRDNDEDNDDNVVIPAVFISKENGDKLYHFINPSSHPKWLSYPTSDTSSRTNIINHMWHTGAGEAFYLTKSHMLSQGDETKGRRKRRLYSYSSPLISTYEEEEKKRALNERRLKEVELSENERRRRRRRRRRVSVEDIGIPILIEPENSTDSVAIAMISGFAFMLTVCGFTLSCISFFNQKC
mmetsp:Transcript_39017/g.50447  ORF Transcript_39017/g.50447 Transcript_39017/m.50447 type:complete len:387 (-) Transcript_39017:1081-2241(-)